MIIQTAPAGTPRLAIMMYEHMALCRQFAHAFGNAEFEPLAPLDLMTFVISNHDAGWADFDRDPLTDGVSGLPCNLNETPAQYITVTSRGSPDYNEHRNPYCGLISSMHSYGLYTGRYGVSNLVLIDNIPEKDRPIADDMLAGELARQERLKEKIAKDPQLASLLDKQKLFQNYKQLQFLDLLALYFNRIHSTERRPQTFEKVPLNAEKDVAVTIEPKADGVYALSPFPFAPTESEFAYAGRRVTPQDRHPQTGWRDVLRTKPTEWERFRLVPGSPPN
jgi:hypothetical protein